MTADEKRARAFERTKLGVDVVKHLTTLSTGSIVVLATLVDKLHKPLLIPEALVAAIGSFLTSVGVSLFYFLLTMRPYFHFYEEDQSHAFDRNVAKVLVSIISIAFLSGIVFLGVFALENINAVTGANSK